MLLDINTGLRWCQLNHGHWKLKSFCSPCDSSAPQARTQPLSIQHVSKWTHSMQGLAALGEGKILKGENRARNCSLAQQEWAASPTSKVPCWSWVRSKWGHIPPVAKTALGVEIYIPDFCKYDSCKWTSYPLDPLLLTSLQQQPLFFLAISHPLFKFFILTH